MSESTAILVARMGSTRLPGKSVMPILGEPMVARMVERIGAASGVSQVVIATSVLPEDDALESLARRIGAKCHRGSPHDVLARVHGAAGEFGGDPIIELLGDNPLVHSDLIDDTLELFHSDTLDSVVNVTTEFPNADPALPRFPVGIRVHVCSRRALDISAQTAPAGLTRENATTFIRQRDDLFRTAFLTAAGKWGELDRPDLTFAVNYRQNYELVRQLFERCYPRDKNFTIGEALRAFDEDPRLSGLMGTPATEGA